MKMFAAAVGRTERCRLGQRFRARRHAGRGAQGASERERGAVARAAEGSRAERGSGGSGGSGGGGGAAAAAAAAAAGGRRREQRRTGLGSTRRMLAHAAAARLMAQRARGMSSTAKVWVDKNTKVICQGA
jgi:hypothetical protein